MGQFALCCTLCQIAQDIVFRVFVHILHILQLVGDLQALNVLLRLEIGEKLLCEKDARV